MPDITTVTSTGSKPHQINDKMTAAFVRFEEDHKGTGRGFLGVIQLIVGIVYPLFKVLGAVLPLHPAGLKRRYTWLKEAKSGLSYIGHGVANIGVGLASLIPGVNADRFGRIEYANEDYNKVLDADPERRFLLADEARGEEQLQYLEDGGDLPTNLS